MATSVTNGQYNGQLAVQHYCQGDTMAVQHRTMHTLQCRAQNAGGVSRHKRLTLLVGNTRGISSSSSVLVYTRQMSGR